jgi:hypothetical protein
VLRPVAEGSTQIVSRTPGTTPAFCTHSELFAKLAHGAEASAEGFVEMAFGDRVADADVHEMALPIAGG